MTTQTALVIVSGRQQRIAASDDLGVGFGIKPSATNSDLTLSPSGTGTLVLFAGNIDKTSAAPLTIGTANASEVRIGAAGIKTWVDGDLEVAGNEVIVGTSTFDDTVTFGDGVGTDLVTFRSAIQGYTGDPIQPSADNTVAFGDDTLRYLEVNATTFNARADNTNTSFATLNATSLTGTASGTFTIAAGAAQALDLTGNAASSWTTSAGALTITAAAASTWSTAAGALTLSGFAGIDLQGNGTSALMISAAGDAVTVQPGATLEATGTGTINLPNNTAPSTVFFEIGGVAVTSAAITAANFDMLFDGSTVTTHTHANASGVTVTGFTTTGLADGDCAYGDAYTPLTVIKTDALSAPASVFLGVVTSVAGSLKVAGIATIKFITGDGAPDNGAPVYLAESSIEASAAGKATPIAPLLAGSYVAEIGICVDNTAWGASKLSDVLLQPKTVVGI